MHIKPLLIAAEPQGHGMNMSVDVDQEWSSRCNFVYECHRELNNEHVVLRELEVNERCLCHYSSLVFFWTSHLLPPKFQKFESPIR